MEELPKRTVQDNGERREEGEGTAVEAKVRKPKKHPSSGLRGPKKQATSLFAGLQEEEIDDYEGPPSTEDLRYCQNSRFHHSKQTSGHHKRKPAFKAPGGHHHGNNNHKGHHHKGQKHARPMPVVGDKGHAALRMYDYFVVVDFEATCEKNNQGWPNEIIEFPIVLIDCRKLQVVGEFHSFVRPVRNPKLTDFCTELTGITQDKVDDAPTITEVIDEVIQWWERTIPAGCDAIFATDGPWDLRNFLHEKTLVRDKHHSPAVFYRYVDIRTTFAYYYNKGNPLKLEPMLHAMKMTFQGRQHSGLDDTRNIARLALEMLKRGCPFSVESRIPIDQWATPWPRHKTLVEFPPYPSERLGLVRSGGGKGSMKYGGFVPRISTSSKRRIRRIVRNVVVAAMVFGVLYVVYFVLLGGTWKRLNDILWGDRARV